MDYFQGVVINFLRADRAVFVNTECCIQLNPGANPDTSGPHWYCDAIAVNHREKAIYLCEITYAKSLSDLRKRLTGWSVHWEAVKAALVRDCALPADWPVRPWVFIPESLRATLEAKVDKIYSGVNQTSMPRPRVTPLEDTLPWNYRSWDWQPDRDTSLSLATGK